LSETPIFDLWPKISTKALGLEWNCETEKTKGRSAEARNKNSYYAVRIGAKRKNQKKEVFLLFKDFNEEAEKELHSRRHGIRLLLRGSLKPEDFSVGLSNRFS